MAGIYIHIPFCKAKCPYCNFFSLATHRHREEFLSALRKETELTRRYLAGEPVETIYVGGGTPSLFRPGEIPLSTPTPNPSPISGEGLSPLPRLGKGPGDGVEITLELNPDDVTEAYLAALQGAAFNRFSIGLQSFSDDELKYLGRIHSANQGVRAVKLLQDAGYKNISIDLIYGIPGSDLNRWEMTLEQAFSLDVPHISAYSLTVEPHTPLAWKIGKGRAAPVNDELQAEQFRTLMKRMKEASYLHYEISNFCKPGQFARHNTNYWKGVPYLGLGPSAHSYNGTSRRWNVSNLKEYIESVNAGIIPYEEEVLSSDQKFNEYIMTSLRTTWGLALSKITADWGLPTADLFEKRAAVFIQQELLTESQGVYFLTDEGKLFADSIAAELFI